MNKFDRLVLLVGQNPLPNLVVADHFLKTVALKKIYLIYSEKTRHYDGTLQEAERLEKILRKRHPEKSDLLPFEKISLSDISKANVIVREIKEKIIDTLPTDCKVHLNYTGGTKAMGIHAYNTIKESNKIGEKSFSYLDARTFQIVDDTEGIITKDLRESIKISFEELITLHGLQRVNEDKDTSEFQDTLHFFQNIIATNKIDEFYKIYNRKQFENKKSGLAEKTKDLKDETKNTKISGLLLDLMLTLPKKYHFFNSDGNYVEPENPNIKHTLMYIDGLWLEEHVFEILSNAFSNLTFYKNWEIKSPLWFDTSKFEIDVVAIKGYQIIGISCTTANRNDICKNKGFEILLRSRQIGGDEAKAFLITMLSKDRVEILQDSLKADTSGGNNILVLGKDDIRTDRLIEKFSDFIR